MKSCLLITLLPAMLILLRARASFAAAVHFQTRYVDDVVDEEEKICKICREKRDGQQHWACQKQVVLVLCASKSRKEPSVCRHRVSHFFSQLCDNHRRLAIAPHAIEK
jgi:hypothetical protein